MRKWMRDRLQRRKKTPAAPSEQPTPAPLQPAYFDAEHAPATESGAETNESGVSSTPASVPQDREVHQPPRSARSSSEEPSVDAQPGTLHSSSRGSPSAGRSRRRRGGRGRGGRGREQAVAQAFASVAGKGSIPALPVGAADEPAEQEMPEAEAQIGQTVEPVVAAAAAPKPPALGTVPHRPPKGVVVLAIGLPGSGKSSWFKRHSVVPLSSDMVRSLLFDDVREQRFQDLVFSNLRSMLKARLIAKRPMNYVDATNLTPQERQHWIKLAKDYQYEVHAIFFDLPLEVCVERHQRRDRVVPEDVMRRMAAKLKPPAFEEGFAKITVVRVKKKESEAR
jgi:predicted kinase